jgi:hypothetical protein
MRASHRLRSGPHVVKRHEPAVHRYDIGCPQLLDGGEVLVGDVATLIECQAQSRELGL